MRLRGREAASHRAERTNAPSHALNPQSSIPHPRPIPVTPSPVTPSPRHPVTPSPRHSGPLVHLNPQRLLVISPLYHSSGNGHDGATPVECLSFVRERDCVCFALTAYVDKRVLVITQDGRTIVGTFAGFDQTTNIILSSSTERIYSLEEGVDEQALGLFVVRGDNITLIGELDEVADKAVDLSTVRAEPIQEIVH
ncbi:BZ3501_MvSof-1269-A2-R1_Chr3-1g05131 [Microbotryum saponariae]|nr:BZ3501_MvSof-1269-A2-R1_Chr3-1g05131 [Microbotryum saponariae]